MEQGQAGPEDGRVAPIAVIGGGGIGVAFAIVFARAGRRVSVFEPDIARRGMILANLRARLQDLHDHELLDEAPETVQGRVTIAADLAAAVTSAAYVQEC